MALNRYMTIRSAYIPYSIYLRGTIAPKRSSGSEVESFPQDLLYVFHVAAAASALENHTLMQVR